LARYCQLRSEVQLKSASIDKKLRKLQKDQINADDQLNKKVREKKSLEAKAEKLQLMEQSVQEVDKKIRFTTHIYIYI